MTGPVCNTAGRERLPRCVAFLDLAGFTALTETHGDDYAADVHDGFVSALAVACSSAADVYCVKHLGDGALLVAASARSMLPALRAAVGSHDEEQVRLRVRAGVHSGPVLRVSSVHGDDYLGHTVNVAARLCARAAPGELLLSAAVRPEVDSLAGDLYDRGALTLRHIALPVQAWGLPLGALVDTIDPVCHMIVVEDDYLLVAEGRHWRFCSSSCRTLFLERRAAG